MYFQFGLYISLGLITMIIMSVIVSGDSVKQRQQQKEALRTLTMPPSTQIRQERKYQLTILLLTLQCNLISVIPLNNSYLPKVDDYVIWHHNGLVHKGWVYFADEAYITIETGIKPKPNCEYTKNERHKYIHTLLLCHPHYWKDLEYILSLIHI